ncbi:hypothetical protein Noda2021_09070 [Candidatus Dependentiae bacterium Noda2021]|nr:hypothetical protein Noda2021_09070 [Candidatus Dependentiae bacterium Noda2021]
MFSMSALFINMSLFIFITPIIHWFKKRKSHHSTHSHNQLGFLSIAATLIATELGASLLLGSSQESLYTAFYGLFYIVGISIGYVILGSGLASRMRALQCSTSAQLLELKYQSSALKKLASCLSMMILYAFLVGELIATKTLLQGLGLESELMFIGLWSLLIIYCLVGGLGRIGISNFAQLGYFAVVFCGIFIYCIFKEPPSLPVLGNFIAEYKPAHFSHLNIFSLLMTLFTTIIYCISEQDVSHPLFAKSSRIIQLASTLGASLFMIFFSIMPLYFGCQAQQLQLTMPEGLSPIIPVIQYLTNDFVVILMLFGIIIAIIATFDYLLSSISSYWTEEFELPPLLKNHPNKIEFITAFNGFAIMAFSYLVSTDLMSIFNVSFELYTCILLVPLFFAYIKKDVKRGAAWGAVGAGIASFILFNGFITTTEKEVAHIIISGLGYIIGYMIADVRGQKKTRPMLSMIRN